MELVLVGVNHRTAGVDTRARFAIGPEEVGARLVGLLDDRLASEALCLSTCNRFEIYAAIEEEAGDHAGRARTILAAVTGQGADSGAPLYVVQGCEVGRHAMRVASGLDSLVLGERQILSQVKEAVALARKAGTIGPVLDRLFNFALHTAKRVQAETELATGAVSVASAAVVLAEKVLGSLTGRGALVIGTGDTGSLVARHVAKRKPSRIFLANRTTGRAAPLAEELGATVISLDDMGRVLPDVDVVVCAARSPFPLLTRATVRAAHAGRRGRPLVLVDISVPRNIDPAAADGDDVFLYSIDALTAVIDGSIAKRRREAARAEAIVGQEVEKFARWMRALSAAPLVRQLHDHFERVRSDEVERSLRHFGPAEREHVERLTRALVNRLLRAPTVRLRADDVLNGTGSTWAQAVRELFALPGGYNAKGTDHDL
ncbi:MAG: glutamyl-tRNA reductase [Vicinamibacterales bacterium]